jgi:DNA polymerase alpha subunit A
MADLLGEVDTNLPSRPPLKSIKSAARRKTRVLSPPVSKRKGIVTPKPAIGSETKQFLNTPPLETADNDDFTFFGSLDDGDFPLNHELPSSPIANALERKNQQPLKGEDDEDEDMMEVNQAVGDYNVKSASVNISGSRPVPKIPKTQPYPSPGSSSPIRPPLDGVDPATWNQVTLKLNVLSSQGLESTNHAKLKLEDAVEGDGSVRFFWTDYTEVHGSLCLFGKVKDKNTGSYVSAFVKIDNILRKLYFLPRPYRHSKSRGRLEYCIADASQDMAEIPRMKSKWEIYTLKLTKS